MMIKKIGGFTFTLEHGGIYTWTCGSIEITATPHYEQEGVLPISAHRDGHELRSDEYLFSEEDGEGRYIELVLGFIKELTAVVLIDNLKDTYSNILMMMDRTGDIDPLTDSKLEDAEDKLVEVVSGWINS